MTSLLLVEVFFKREVNKFSTSYVGSFPSLICTKGAEIWYIGNHLMASRYSCLVIWFEVRVSDMMGQYDKRCPNSLQRHIIRTVTCISWILIREKGCMLLHFIRCTFLKTKRSFYSSNFITLRKESDILMTRLSASEPFFLKHFQIFILQRVYKVI